MTENILEIVGSAKELGAFGMVVVATIFLYRQWQESKKKIEEKEEKLEQVTRDFSDTVKENIKTNQAGIEASQSIRETMKELTDESRTRGQMMQALIDEVRLVKNSTELLINGKIDTERLLRDIDRYLRETRERSGSKDGTVPPQ